jgi:hypothetical protein
MSMAAPVRLNQQRAAAVPLRKEEPVNTSVSHDSFPDPNLRADDSRLPRTLRFVMFGGLGTLYALSLVLPSVRHVLAQIAALLPH